jgi:hypothetical protein
MKKINLDLFKYQQQLRNTARADIRASFTDMFSSLMNGTATIGQAFHKLGTDIRTIFVNLIAQRFAQKLFGPESGFGKAINSMVDLVFDGVSRMVGIQVAGQEAQTAAATQTTSSTASSTRHTPMNRPRRKPVVNGLT